MRVSIQKVLLLLTLFVSISCAGTPFQRGIPSNPDTIGQGEVTLALEKPTRWVLPNGLIVLYRHDDEVPLMRGQLYVPGGTVFDPPEKAGLAAFVGSQMREGAVKPFTPEQFDERLDALGAQIESTFGVENGRVSFSSLREDFPEVFSLFARVARAPQFDPERLMLAKKLSTDGIRRRRDSPETIASMALTEIVYGKNNPFARSPSLASVERIRREDLIDFHHRFVRPNGAVLVLVGAVPEEQLREAVTREFGNWTRQETPLPPLPEVTETPAPGIYVLTRDLNQATVMMGHLGPRRLVPEMYAISLYNRLLGGGGFESKLFSEVRSRLGLAYMIDGGIAPGPVAGMFEVALATRNEQTVRAIQKTIEVIQDTTSALPDDQRVDDAKISIARRFVFSFAETLDAVGRAALLEVLHYPEDYDQTYLPRIRSVTDEEILTAAQKFVWPSKIAIVVVGGVPAEEFSREFGGKVPVYRLGFDTEPKIGGRVS